MEKYSKFKENTMNNFCFLWNYLEKANIFYIKAMIVNDILYYYFNSKYLKKSYLMFLLQLFESP